MRQNLFAFAVFASMLPFSAAQGQSMVQSQEGIALQNEILQLQQQVQGLQANPGSGAAVSNAPPPASGGAPPDNSVVTSLLTQVQQLQAQVSQLNGQVDTLQNQVNTQHDATEKEIGDMKFQMTGGATAPAATAAATGASTAAASPPLPPAATAAPHASTTATGTLKQGVAAYSKHDYKGSETAARSVLATAKSSPEGYQAQYLLAQSLAAQGRPQDAAIAYDDAYNRSHGGSYAAASLLGLANSLTTIHQQAAACDTLATLNSQFPTPPTGLAPRIATASHRAHCS